MPKPLGVNIVSGKWIFRQKLNPDGSLSLATKLGGWFVVSFINLAWIMVILTAQWLNLQLFASCLVLQSEILGLFINWMWRMPSFMVILMNPCIVNIHLVSLIQHTQTMFAVSPSLCVGSSRIHAHGFSNSPTLCAQLAFSALGQIHLCLFSDKVRRRHIFYSMLMILYWLHRRQLFRQGFRSFVSFYQDFCFRGSTTGLHLCQHQYALDLLDHDGMASCHPIATPINTKSKLSTTSGERFSDPTRYRSIVGTLQCVAITCRNISCVVQQVCIFVHDPSKPHF